ncbi:MAG: membrane protein insertase YidC [Desulfobacterales bacterium]|jgi:YidC/Oxa1 family membrane protein insertase|nr:membrane protein insertase YidC [Desulfobacterales bacterium]
MDQMRLLLALVLSFLVFMLWNVFFGQEAKQKPAPQLQQEAQREDKGESVAPAPVLPKESKPILESTGAVKPARPSRQITVETPLYKAILSEKGAGINGFILKQFRAAAAADSPLMNLFPDNGAVDGLIVGLSSKGPGAFENEPFRANLDSDQLSLTDGTREIVFRSITESGIQIENVYRFAADSYAIGFEVRLTNNTDQPLKDSLTVALRNWFPNKKNSQAFEGPSALVNQKIEQIPIDEIEKKGHLNGHVSWMALESRYFATSLVPLKDQEASVRFAAFPGNIVEAQYAEPEQTFAPRSRNIFEYQLFFGPKSMNALRQAGHELSRLIDFGTFDVLAKPCLWLMNYLYTIIPNYGVAIIILTLLSKILLWPLGTKSYKSMSQMKKLQPLIQELRVKYKNDRKKMNEEIMRLHRTYNINPLGGCLPMLVQIPVFFALYRMLDQAIELRHAHFIWWINDLSAPDRLFNFDFSIPFMEPPYGIPVLTLVMGATMFWQQKMTPPAGDPAQAKMMLLMPVVFTFIFINFSAGLVLYWLVNNVLSIGQQYYTQKKFG